MRVMRMDGVAIAVAPNGGRRTKADHPALPLDAPELAETAVSCLDAGAAMLHMHVRDKVGRHILDAEAYREAIRAVRQAVGDRIVIQITTEAVGLYQPQEQMDVVRAVRPEAASMALRELVPDASHETRFAQFLAFTKAEEIVPQIILYHPDEARQLKDMMARGMVPYDDLPVLHVLGRYTEGQRSAPADLLPFLAPDMPRFGHFMVCAFGAREAACVTAGALLGGHVRTGFENNLLLPDGSAAPDNAALVSTAAQALSALGLMIADADGLRTAWQRLVG
ncbi:3-keto-5-aminohexanoate cleavage protein [Chelativorans sp. AA-79]|uniref:3-keto-5-aminohexanoate cleavage protein n=1 Tax=Chelativorans sp. AA-79 TaxID=3028735 RepID=UPI0023F73E5D|nr:3-keto-5-aminohexanoate cleavage protein [Chelativorans sp. AA-79]WEX08368.1 3-keto-5-aminohexanoate cleavage protein [Chelativorans sp. AA-79]